MLRTHDSPQFMRFDSGAGLAISGCHKNFTGALFRLANRNHPLLVLIPNPKTGAAFVVHLEEPARTAFVVVKINACVTFLSFDQDGHFVTAMADGNHFSIEKQKWRTWLFRELLLLTDDAQNVVQVAPKPRHLSFQLI